MGKATSKLREGFGLFVKALVGLALVPPLIGLIAGTLRQLDVVVIGSRSAGSWAAMGAVGAVGVYLFLYQPVALFRVQHRMLSGLSAWLFGGQIATGGAQADSGKRAKGKAKAEPVAGAGTAASGSTLVVLSPYLVPLYTLLGALAAWAARGWWPADAVDAVSAVWLGAALMFHWIMAARELQELKGNKERVPFASYLLSVALIGLGSLTLVVVTLPASVPGVSVSSVFADAVGLTRNAYVTVFRTLFL